MQTERLASITLLAVLAAGGDGGCFGRRDDEPPPLDASIDLLSVRASTVRPGPHPRDSIVELVAEATGGAPPYLFTWKEPAITIDPNDGRGEIAVGQSDVIVTVAVVDSNGEVAGDSIPIELEGGRRTFTIEIRGLGHVDAGVFGVCMMSSCAFEVDAGVEVDLRANPIGDGRFDGWAGCSTSASRSIAIQVANSDVVCTAHFSAGSTMLPPCTAVPPPPGPTADVVVRPAITDPPFAKNALGFFVVPPDVRIFIDGSASRPRAGFDLDYDWIVTWDPLQQVPDDPVPFFEIQSPALSQQRSDAYLTVIDDCGRTATATATYITE